VIELKSMIERPDSSPTDRTGPWAPNRRTAAANGESAATPLPFRGHRSPRATAPHRSDASLVPALSNPPGGAAPEGGGWVRRDGLLAGARPRAAAGGFSSTGREPACVGGGAGGDGGGKAVRSRPSFARPPTAACESDTGDGAGRQLRQPNRWRPATRGASLAQSGQRRWANVAAPRIQASVTGYVRPPRRTSTGTSRAGASTRWARMGRTSWRGANVASISATRRERSTRVASSWASSRVRRSAVAVARRRATEARASR